MRRSATLVLALTLTLLANGCSLNQLTKTQQALESCEFTLQSIDPQVSVSMNGFTPVFKVLFNVQVGVNNTTDFNLAVNRLDLRLFLDDLELANASNSRFVNIPKGQRSTLYMTLELDPAVVSKKLVDRLQGGQVKYRAVATFYFKVLGLDIPISKTLAKDTL